MVVLAVMATLTVGACRKRAGNGELLPPDDAPAWENRFGVAYDDAYTRQPINLVGRAPHDVRDQQLFAARLGHAAIVAKVSVDQVWARGRYEGDQNQYLDITIQRVLMGELPKNTAEEQSLEVRAHEELTAELQDQEMILFVRWAPGAKPPFHHHLMPSDPELEGYIEAFVEHAQAEGVLDASGSAVSKGKDRKRKRKADKKKGNKKKGKYDIDESSDMPVE